ncbi:MAG: S8 family serine peptidase, partial [Micromonosporaceae bacterium]|nr:S8 family serine peptidase [Micromonosporaceae bacterium]
LGQPGLFGEKLFVVMRDQADLSIIDTSGGGQARRDERARATYQLLVRQANASQASLRRQLDRLHLSYTPYYLVNGLEVEGGPAVRAWLSRRDDVDRVLVSQQLRPLPAAPPTHHGGEPAPESPEWNITMLRADRVWAQLGDTGAGIVVGTSDSGVDGAHPALAGGFRGGADSWYDPVRHTRTPNDTQGHGTHTLATAVGRTGTGVAPGAQWIGCVNLYRNLGNPARYLDCLQFMLAPFPAGGDPFTDGRPERAPHVLTNSWGCPRIEGCDEGALRQATRALAAAGIFTVVAAGNTGPFCGSVEDPPAPYPDVLTVGAVDRNRDVAKFSSRGPTDAGAVKPDVVAPGADVLSAMPGGGYARLDGTSMATPHVAGVVALMWSANPALIGDLARTRGILRRTAQPVTPTYLSRNQRDRCGQEANITGAGVVDAFAAVQAARAAAR